VPRVINILCSRALLGAYARGDESVSPELLRMAAGEIFGTIPGRQSRKKGMMIGTSILAVMLFGAWISLGTNFIESTYFPVPGKRKAMPEMTPELAVVTVHEPVASVSEPKPQEDSEVQSERPMPEPAVREEPLHEQPVVAVTLPPADENMKIVVAEANPLIDHEDPLEWIRALSNGSGEEPEYQTLFQSWGMQYSPNEAVNPEEFARQNRFTLVRQKGSFGYLRRLNRPAILRLTDLSGKEFSATLTAIEGEHVVLQNGASTRKVAVSALVRQWLGDFTILWQPPPGYRRVLMPGDRGAAVSWLARQFEVLHGLEKNTQEKNVYDDSLQADVRAFQASEGIPADGLVGLLTLIRLNSRINSDQPQLERIALTQEVRNE